MLVNGGVMGQFSVVINLESGKILKIDIASPENVFFYLANSVSVLILFNSTHLIKHYHNTSEIE